MGKLLTLEEDPSMPLSDWKILIDKLIIEHGEKTRLKADGGLDEVELVLFIPSKKKKTNGK